LPPRVISTPSDATVRGKKGSSKTENLRHVGDVKFAKRWTWEGDRRVEKTAVWVMQSCDICLTHIV